MAAEPEAAARVVAVYRPFYDRLGALFADCTPDETAVIADRFERAAAEVRTHCAQVRSGEPDGEPETGGQ
ncbi:hypothetical protein ACFCZ1_01405 [Streptomyces sp. NPDC056224]|uniref:hypothetical protein n=1 Tax=Streptomyces sp. NPDC056224 TaxID=3345750 RepID=UPI0035E0EDC7